jgi:tRNA(Ile)-lysidine synthase
MEFSPERLEERLHGWPKPRRYVVLASGGGDSTALLHAMAALREHMPAPLVALHFDHGLNEGSTAWRDTVAREAETLGIEFFAENLNLDRGVGGRETRARQARYARLRNWMRLDDCCLAAHHADDQAETFLLQALRGGGPAGLAAMPEFAQFGLGWLARPLLVFTRAELRAWARARDLDWIEDPGNRDFSAPRNRLRHRVWPELDAGWPAAARTLARSAALAAEAAALAEEVAAEDLARMGVGNADHLPIPALLDLSSPRRRALLRHWLHQRGFAVPETAKLLELEREFIARDPGARALLPFGDAEAHRFRGYLHVLRPLPEPPAEPIELLPGEYVELGPLGRVGLIPDTKGPLGPSVKGELELRFRLGGEVIRPAGTAHHRKLKKLLQEAGVLPWMRYRLPLLYGNGSLAAVAGIAVADEFAGKGWRFDWCDGPPVQ